MNGVFVFTWGAFSSIAQLRRHPARAIVFVTAIVAVFAAVALPIVAQAVDSNLIAEFLATVLSFFVQILGKLLLLIVYLLTMVAQYNGFITSAAVTNGWVIVRDVANMFFIVILLITAFATILNVESYQWKQILPKLLVAAILINFSKTIAGIFIDISQVVMLTFVNGFAAAAGGNFTSAFQIDKLLEINPKDEAAAQITKVLGGYVLALLMLVIAIGVTVIMTVMLLFRIVMLWALVVLSPIPYLLKVLPGKGSSYADKWWSEFSNYLITGPILAFFLWLALVSVGSGSIAEKDGFTSAPVRGSPAELAQMEGSLNAGGTNAGKPEPFLSFLIAICMLIAGTKIAGEMGTMGAGGLNKFREQVGKKGLAFAKKAAYYGTGAAGAVSLGTRAVQSQRMQNALGRVAAIPLVGNLALRGVGAIGAARAKRQKEAEERVAAAKGNPHELAILGRLSGGRAFGADAAAMRAAARKRAPSTIPDVAERQRTIAGMDAEALNGLSAGELYRIQGDLSRNQRLDVLQKGNRVQQSAVGDLGGFDSYSDWLQDQTAAESATLRAAGMGKDDADREARRRMRGRMPPSSVRPPSGYSSAGSGARDSIDTKYSAEYDADRQRRTREKVEEYEKQGKDFFDSDGFKVNIAQYYSKDEYNENASTATAIQQHREEEGYQPGGVSGVRRLQQQAAQAATTGAPMKEARLAIDFSMIGMSGNGAHLTGKDKDDAIEKIGSALKDQGYAANEVAQIQEAMKSAGSLNLINKGREAGSARYTLVHESVHGQLEELDPNALKSIWESIATKEREAIVQKVRDEWKNAQMSEEEAMHEYFTDGMANATRWGRAGGSKLPPEIVAQMKALGVQFSPRPRTSRQT